MKTEKPIIFSGAMVKALLSGVKVQTRRIIKPQPEPGFKVDVCHYSKSGFARWKENGACTCEPVPCRYATDALYVRETFAELANGEVIYRADQPTACGVDWTPSIFLPRKLSRITLQVERVRVQRVSEISPMDCYFEGALMEPRVSGYNDRDAVIAFAKLWDSINGKKPGCSFEDAPFVWVVEFKRI